RGHARLAADLASRRGERRALTDPNMRGRPTCRVVIVTHDSDATLERCVETVLAQHEVDLDVRIVDNASRRDPASLLRELDHCTVVRNAHNAGFSAACNQGARDCK